MNTLVIHLFPVIWSATYYGSDFPGQTSFLHPQIHFILIGQMYDKCVCGFDWVLFKGSTARSARDW